MIQQAIDFKEESDALYQLLKPLTDTQFEQKTQFKDWTINDVLGHLHMGNWAADLSLNNVLAFDKFMAELNEEFTSGGHLRTFELKWLEGLKNSELLETWRSYYLEMTDRFKVADPKARVKWVGPDMSVRSSITSRLMETWAHGQEVYDNLGVVRENKDRIKSIVQLGINTFSWTYKNRGIKVPEQKPHVVLKAPSKETWSWNDPSDTNKIEGTAEDFCQVVTQVRNIEDTTLTMTGDTATQWMSIAQCFAGPAENPPEKGTRHTITRDN